MEREGEGRGRRGGGEMRKRGIVIGGMVIGLLLGCNNGLAELEKRNTFFDSVIKIGHEFQEIFGIFGNAVGDALGFNAIKPEDNRSKVGEHFNNVKKGLGDTKAQLDKLAKEITSTPHTDIISVDAVIKGAGEVLTKLIASVDKLAGVTNASVKIDDAEGSATAATGADKNSVDTIIKEVKAIIETAKKSGVKIEEGKAGGKVNNGDGPKVLAGNAQASANDAAKLAAEVAKADPWAMIDKIQSANTVAGTQLSGDKTAGELATGSGNTGVNAKTNADLAAAVALKAMTKDGKFVVQPASREEEPIKASAVSAVNKVLGVLDEIIRKTVSIELGKIKDAVKGIQYSENAAEKSEGATK